MSAMDSNKKGRNEGSPDPQGDHIADDPDRDQEPDEPRTGTDKTSDDPDDMKARIMEKYRQIEGAKEDPDASEDEEDGDGQDDHDADHDAEDDSQQEGADEDAENDEDDDDLDEVQKTLPEKKAKKAFARLRTQTRELKRELADARTYVEFAKQVEERLEDLGATQEDFDAALESVSLRKANPLKALKSLGSDIKQVMASVKAEYDLDDAALAKMAGLAIQQEPVLSWKERHPDLAEAVELGALDEDKAKELAELKDNREREREKPEPKQKQTPERKDDDLQALSKTMQEVNKELGKMHFFTDTSKEARGERIKELVDRVATIAEDYGIDLTGLDARKKAFVQAARQIMAEESSNTAPRKKRSKGKMLRHNEGTTRRLQEGKQPTSIDEIREQGRAFFVG